MVQETKPSTMAPVIPMRGTDRSAAASCRVCGKKVLDSLEEELRGSKPDDDEEEVKKKKPKGTAHTTQRASSSAFGWRERARISSDRAAIVSGECA